MWVRIPPGAPRDDLGRSLINSGSAVALGATARSAGCMTGDAGQTARRDRTHDAGGVPPARARRSSTGSPTTTSGSSRSRCSSQVAPGDDPRGAAARTRRRRASRSRPCCADLDRVDPARHHALAAPVVLRLLPGQRQRAGRSSATCSPPGWACRACCGRPRRRPPSSRRTSSTGWPNCSTCPAGSARRARRRGHPAHRLGRGAGRAAGRAAPRQRRAHRARRRRGRPVRRLHLRPDALLGREGVPDRRARRRRAAQDRRRPGDAGGPARAPARADRAPTARPASTPVLVVASVGTTGTGAVDPVARTGRDRRASTAPGCTSTPRGPASPRSRPELRWLNDGLELRRLVRHQPAQVAAHQLRLRRVLGRRPGRAGRRAVDPARVPAQRRDRVRRGDRLPRLARAARPAVPRAQAVGGASAGTAPRGCARTSAVTSGWPRSSPAGSRPTSASSWSRRTRWRWSRSGCAPATTRPSR